MSIFKNVSIKIEKYVVGRREKKEQIKEIYRCEIVLSSIVRISLIKIYVK